jgi:uncharacterized lipoprotein YehR (DUF1307 family)
MALRIPRFMVAAMVVFSALPGCKRKLPAQRYIYILNGKKVVLHFVDGKLIGQEGSFDQ